MRNSPETPTPDTSQKPRSTHGRCTPVQVGGGSTNGRSILGFPRHSDTNGRRTAVQTGCVQRFFCLVVENLYGGMRCTGLPNTTP